MQRNYNKQTLTKGQNEADKTLGSLIFYQWSKDRMKVVHDIANETIHTESHEKPVGCNGRNVWENCDRKCWETCSTQNINTDEQN